MVDYFALIAPTIESLSKSTVEERRQVYDRLIKMLEVQLRSADPPRSEIDILRERIDLEAAIRRVERRIQAGQIMVAKPPTPDVPKPGDEPIEVSSSASPQSKPVAPSGIIIEQPAAETISLKVSDDLAAAGGKPMGSQRVAHISAENPVPLQPEPPQPEPPQPVRPFRFPEKKSKPVPPPRSTDWASLMPQPRPVDRPPIVDARSAPARPDQSPAPQGSQGQNEPDVGRPIYGQRGGEPRQSASSLADLPAAFRGLPDTPGSRPPVQPPDQPREDLPPLDPAIVEAGQALSQSLLPRHADESGDAKPVDIDPMEFLRGQKNSPRYGKRREPVHESQPGDAGRPTVSVGERPRASILPMRGSGGWKRMAIISACIIAILGGIATTAYLLRDDPAEFKIATGKYAPSEKPAAEEKIADRLEPQTPPQNAASAKPNGSQAATQQQAGNAQPGPSAPTPDANGVLTQKAMLIMESAEQSVPMAPIYGRVTWKLETLKSVVANASEIGSRATVEIPELGLSATFVFRRNRDPQSANSHMIEVTFSLGDNNTTGKVRDIRVPELRGDDASRGTPLSGIPVPVTENVFLIGLNALPTEMQKNLDLLRSQNWFAMPLRFANGKRGMLIFEKGKTGERIMEDAMQAWKAN